MKTPYIWNTLAEAAAWLEGETAEAWSERRVLHRVVLLHQSQEHRDPPNPPTILRAAPPVDVVINRRRFVSPRPKVGDALPLEFRLPWETVPLFVQEVVQLLACGETVASSIYRDERFTDKLDLIEPPLRVTVAMVGIVRRALPALLSVNESASTTPTAPAAVAPGPGATRNRADLMSDEIETAIADLGGTPDAAKIMRRLRALAGRDGSCIVKTVPEGVEWRGRNGKTKTLDAEALRKRLDRRARPPEAHNRTLSAR